MQGVFNSEGVILSSCSVSFVDSIALHPNGETWRNLSHFLQQLPTPPPLSWSIAWAKALSQAILPAHKQGLVYGHLLPHHVSFQQPNNQPIKIQVELAPAPPDEREPVPFAQPFLAPEVTHQQATPLSDIYSIAAFLYALLFGGPPNQPLQPLGSIAQQQASLAPLTHVLHKALSNDPSHRYANLEEWLHALEEAAQPVLEASAVSKEASLHSLPPNDATQLEPSHSYRSKGRASSRKLWIGLLLAATLVTVGLWFWRP